MVEATPKQLKKVAQMLFADQAVIPQQTVQATIEAPVRTGLLQFWDASVSRAEKGVERISFLLGKARAYADLFCARGDIKFLEQARSAAFHLANSKMGSNADDTFLWQAFAIAAVASVSKDEADLNEARRVALHVRDDHRRLGLLVELARISRTGQRSREARCELEKVSEPFHVIIDTCSIAKNLGAGAVSPEQMKRAENLTSDMGDNTLTASCFSELAMAYAALHNYDRAREMVKLVQGAEFWKIEALIEIARKSKSEKDRDVLKRAIGSSDDEDVAEEKLPGIILLGDYDRARRIFFGHTRSVGGVYRYELTVSCLDLARETLDGGDLVLAQNLAEGVRGDKDEKGILLAKIARTAAEVLAASR